MALSSQAQIDARALKRIGREAWKAAGEIPGIDPEARLALAQSILQVMGQAYIQDRGMYLFAPKEPKRGTGPTQT